MAGPQDSASADAILRRAIEDSLRVVGGWITLMICLGILSVCLGFAILYMKVELFVLLPVTLSPDTLFSGMVFWVAALVAMTLAQLTQDRAIAAVSRYVSERLAVPIVLCTAQRAGRPEVLSSAALESLEAIRRVMAGNLPHVAISFVTAPVLLALIFAMHWVAFAASVAFCVIGAVLSLLMARAGQQAATLSGKAKTQAFGLAADAMRSGEAVLAMGMLPRLVRHWTEVAAEGAGEAWAHERRAERLKTTLEILAGMLRGSMIFLLVGLMLSGANVNAALAGAILVVGMVVTPFLGMGTHVRGLNEGVAAWRRLREMMRATAAIPEGIAFAQRPARLTAEHLSFGYRGPQPSLFRNLNLTVEAGEIVAIVGASGSGKSTLLRLLMGILRPGSGGAYLDGHATSQWDRRDLARHAGFLPQDALLSRATVAEVIARLEEPDMPEVIEAARRAGAHRTIVELPCGYATPLDGRFQLSMGQRHRIALARALYGRPRFLLLDELAGSLDAEGEAAVAGLLRRLRSEGVGVIFTTHRPALVATADRVLAIRQGMLVPAGEAVPAGRTPRLSHGRRSALVTR